MINALLDSIRADLDDDTPRRILADYLTDQQDPRGDFIAVQCELARLTPQERRRSPLGQQESDLLDRHEARWLGTLVNLVPRYRFQRGFLQLELDERSVERRTLRQFQVEPALAWVEEIRFTGPVHHYLALGTALDRLSFPGLDLSNALGSWIGLGLRGWPPLSELNRLNLAGNQMDTVVLDSVLTNLMITCLRSLNLANNRLDQRSMIRLAESSLARTVTRLDLSQNQLGDPGVAYLVADTSICAGLRQLKLASNRMEETGLAAIVASPYLRKIEILDLAHNSLDDAGMEILAQAMNLESLQVLDLSYCGIGYRGIETLLATTWLNQLMELHLHGNGLNAFYAERLREQFGRRVYFDPAVRL